MQPQEPTPSIDQPATDATAADTSSESSAGTPAESWGGRLLSRLFRNRPESSEAEQETSTEQPTSPALTLTQEEIDRRVQAETDRREAKRLADARAAERKRLRDEDPWGYAEQDRQAETAEMTNAQVGTLFASIGAEHDKYTLDPLVTSLPEAERARIMAMEGAGQGLNGRKLIVSEALKSLEKHWKSEGAKDAEHKLRRNPAFRKQVLAEMRGQTVEPEFLPSGRASENDRTVSEMLRGQLSARH